MERANGEREREEVSTLLDGLIFFPGETFAHLTHTHTHMKVKMYIHTYELIEETRLRSYRCTHTHTPTHRHRHTHTHQQTKNTWRSAELMCNILPACKGPLHRWRTKVHSLLLLCLFPFMTHSYAHTHTEAEAYTGALSHTCLINSVRQPRPTLPLCCRAIKFGAKYTTCAEVRREGAGRGRRGIGVAISSSHDPLW